MTRFSTSVPSFSAARCSRSRSRTTKHEALSQWVMILGARSRTSAESIYQFAVYGLQTSIQNTSSVIGHYQVGEDEDVCLREAPSPQWVAF